MTVPLMHALVEAGADIIELGVPFSDPMADGPTHSARFRACAEAWCRPAGCAGDGGRVSQDQRDDAGGADGLRQSDRGAWAMRRLPRRPEARRGWRADGGLSAGGMCRTGFVHLQQHDIDPIFLLSPTTPEARFEQVAKLARGFIYYVSLKGVTGSANLDLQEVAQKIPLIQRRCQPADRRRFRHSRCSNGRERWRSVRCAW